MSEQSYLNLLSRLLNDAKTKEDRTGTGTYSIFGAHMRFNLRAGFPLLTTKKVHLTSIIHELLWFIQGSTHVSYLQERGVSIWDEWSTAEQCAHFGRSEGDLGPIYGHQWRNFGASKKTSGGYQQDGFDQLAWVVSEIKKNPNSRRLIVSGWHPADAQQVALPPCHTLFQFFVRDGKLSCQLYQRSADFFLGVPFNIASYALLTHMVAQVCGLGVQDFVWTGGDVHLYRNHANQAAQQLTRAPLPPPALYLNPEVDDIFKFEFADIRVDNYEHHPAIKAPVAI